jgi:methionyl aminopeptidase
MRENGRILAGVIQGLEKMVGVGVNGKELDDFAESEIRSQGAVPSFKNYDVGDGNLFPYTICFSLNEEVVHGFATEDKIIQDGDLVKIDIGLKKNGFHADMARTFLVGKVSQKAKKLTEDTRQALNSGLKQIKDGARLFDFSQAVQDYAESQGYSVVKDLVGHGIGRKLHQAPQIPNYVHRHFENFTFQEGMTLALEPMINLGISDVKIADDGWTFITADGKLSAHWENTIVVTKKGFEILTSIN